MKNLKAYGLSVAIIWPWPSWLGICWKVHLGPMEGVWHRFSFEEGKPKQRLKLIKVNQTLKNQMKTWLLLALKPYTNRLFESNIGPSPADLLALYPHTWAAYIMGTSTYFNKTNSNQECPTITVTLWDSDHFYSFFPDLHPWRFRVFFMNFMSETVPATRYQSWNARESVLCSPLSASCRPIDVPGSLAGTSVGAAFGWSCTSRPRKCLARHVTKTMQELNAYSILLNHNYIHGGIWPNTIKYSEDSALWSSSFTVHPASIPNTRSNKAWHQRSHRFLFVSIPNRVLLPKCHLI